MARTLWISAGFALACGMANGGACAQGPKQIAGVASYYDKNYSGRTASGAHYDGNKLTAAHRTLPFGTPVRVTNLDNGRNTVVTIVDRGPFARGRIIDVSTVAAGVLGMRQAGVVHVRLEKL